jgi:hypothetical protein
MSSKGDQPETVKRRSMPVHIFSLYITLSLSRSFTHTHITHTLLLNTHTHRALVNIKIY